MPLYELAQSCSVHNLHFYSVGIPVHMFSTCTPAFASDCNIGSIFVLIIWMPALIFVPANCVLQCHEYACSCAYNVMLCTSSKIFKVSENNVSLLLSAFYHCIPFHLIIHLHIISHHFNFISSLFSHNIFWVITMSWNLPSVNIST